MIKCVAVDLGGVLFSEGKSVALARLSDVHGYDRQAVSAILTSAQSILLRKGLLSDEDFWQWAQQQLPLGYDAGLIKEEWYRGYVLDNEIYQLVSELRKNYVIVAFSGNIASRIAFLEQKYHFRHLFDAEVYSFEVHATKPEREFVEAMIAKSGSQPEEIVYVDDNENYAQIARQVGVKVVIHRRGQIQALRTSLRELGVSC